MSNWNGWWSMSNWDVMTQPVYSLRFGWSTNVHMFIFITQLLLANIVEKPIAFSEIPGLGSKSGIFLCRKNLWNSHTCMLCGGCSLVHTQSFYRTMSSSLLNYILGYPTWNITEAPIARRLWFVFPDTNLSEHWLNHCPKLILPTGMGSIPWLWRVISSSISQWFHVKQISLKSSRGQLTNVLLQ